MAHPCTIVIYMCQKCIPLRRILTMCGRHNKDKMADKPYHPCYVST